MQELIFEELKESMDKALGALEKSFSKVRTGRASLSLLDGIRVEYYGTSTPLNQVASLSIPESRLIVISPWDSSVLGAIEKAIQKSDLGLMPSNDGKLIRLAIPAPIRTRSKIFRFCSLPRAAIISWVCRWAMTRCCRINPIRSTTRRPCAKS